MRFKFLFLILTLELIYSFHEACAVDTISTGTNSDGVVFRDKVLRPVKNTETSTGSVVFKDKKNISTKSQQKCQAYITEACNGTVRSNLNPTNSNKKKKKTGTHVLRKRAQVVVGGRDSLPKEYPHMALIGYGEYSNVKWSCGGSIISEQYILSAAHCTSTSASSARWARLGELDLSTRKDNADPRDFSIIEIIAHPEYKSPSLYNDIALFKLNATVRFNSFIRPICLNARQDLNFSRVTATGWGSTGYGERESPILQTVDIYIQDEENCKKIYKNGRLKDGFNSSTMICAGYMAGGKDTCQGDSGGPLHVNMERGCSKINLQIGITSFGEGCGFVDTPAIYTRISFYLSWIESIVFK